jgi:XTP/dITP diphosphohydrolase
MAAPLPRLVVASGNAGKLRELRALAGSLAAEIVSQSELGVAAVAETERSLLGNALLKARHAARATGAAALADDSGLEVDALGGAPGVYSARYAGEGASDAANNARLLAALAGVPPPRRARYRAVLVLVTGPDDPAPLVAEGSWEGRIATTPRGAGGFGYDPLFLPGEDERSVAELAPAEKNRRSHRAQALAALLAAWRSRP